MFNFPIASYIASNFETQGGFFGKLLKRKKLNRLNEERRKKRKEVEAATNKREEEAMARMSYIQKGK